MTDRTERHRVKSEGPLNCPECGAGPEDIHGNRFPGGKYGALTCERCGSDFDPCLSERQPLSLWIFQRVAVGLTVMMFIGFLGFIAWGMWAVNTGVIAPTDPVIQDPMSVMLDQLNAVLMASIARMVPVALAAFGLGTLIMAVADAHRGC